MATKLFWQDDPKIDAWLLKPMFILSIILLAIAIQYQDLTAEAYTWLALITFLGYIGSRTKKVGGLFVWQGLGLKKNIIGGVGAGVGVYILIEVLGLAVGVPFAIGGGLILNILYRGVSAVVFEEGCFRSLLYPTFKGWFGNPFSAAILSSVLWSGFHIVALKGNPDQVVMLFVVGVIFALVNERFKSSMPSYVAHFIRNMLVTVG